MNTTTTYLLILSFFITNNILATTFTSTQDGDWNAAATWGGGGVPGDGDDVVIAHHITISSNSTIGIGSGTAIAIQDAGTLTLSNNITLVCKGNIVASGNIILQSGANLEMDTPLASSIQISPGTTAAHLQINGTTNAHCAVRAVGVGDTRIMDDWQAGGGRVVATFCDFERLTGDTLFKAIEFVLPANGDPYSFTDCTFNQCSQIKPDNQFSVPLGAVLEFTRCKWTNSVLKSPLGMYEEWFIFEAWSEYGATGKLIECDFDQRVGLMQWKDYEVEDCVFRDGLYRRNGNMYINGVVQSFKRNFVRWDGDCQECLTIDYGSTIEDCIFIMDDPSGWNPHFGQIGEGTGTTNITGSIFWWTGNASNAEGDGFFVNAASSGTRADNTVIFERNIFMPNANGPGGDNNTSCTGFTLLLESTNKQIVFKRNTVFTGNGSGGLSIGETNLSTTGDVAYVKSNLFVGGNSSNGIKINNWGNSQIDVFLAEDVDFNAGWQIADAAMFGNGSGKGYDDFTFSGSNVVGANDLDDTNPVFFDPNRTPANWTSSLDITMDALSPCGDSTMQQLLLYLREGFRPQNGALQGAGDPNEGSPDIGAVDITTIANNPPTVSLTAPMDSSVFTTPIDITLMASANDTDGTIDKVEFFANAVKIGEDNTAPFEYTWTNVPGASYALSAVATDNDGASASSNTANILVHDPNLPKISNDIGDEDDFNVTSQIYFDLFYWENNYNIPIDNANFIHQETADSFWVFTEAPAYPDLIKSRAIRMTAYAEFYASVIGQGDTVYLSIRYKDNVPVYYGGEPVYAHNGTEWIQIGALGGAFDHQWKVEVIAVPPANLAVTNDRYRFKIGDWLWSRGLKSFLSIDRIELATSPASLIIEPDMPGYYPSSGDGNFDGMNKNSPWLDDNGDPYFPIGLAAGWTGMSDSLFQQVADGGFNTLVFNNWMVWWDPYAAGDVWDSLPSPSHYGFSEFLDACDANGLKAIGVFQNDIKAPVVQNYFGSEAACLAYIKSSVEKNKDHPALLAWSPVDEPDHSNAPIFYAPVEWCLDVKKTIREADPNHPIYALEIGWRLGGFGHFKDIADYQGYDVYPEVGEQISLIGGRADQLVAEMEGEKPFIAYLKAYDRDSADAYMSFGEAYLALIHGANGIFYWVLEDSGPIWDTLSQIANEVNALTNVLVSPAFFIDRNGAFGTCTDDADEIEQALKFGADGFGYILSSNTVDSAITDVTFFVDSLQAGTTIEVLFENRTIIAEAGKFTDNFNPYGRHVYKISDYTLCQGMDLMVNYPDIPPGYYSASQSVESNGKVSNCNQVIFSGGNSILLNANFEVELGAEFEGKVENCGN